MTCNSFASSTSNEKRSTLHTRTRRIIRTHKTSLKTRFWMSTAVDSRTRGITGLLAETGASAAFWVSRKHTQVSRASAYRISIKRATQVPIRRTTAGSKVFKWDSRAKIWAPSETWPGALKCQCIVWAHSAPSMSSRNLFRTSKEPQRNCCQYCKKWRKGWFQIRRGKKPTNLNLETIILAKNPKTRNHQTKMRWWSIWQG